jgi:hypothetical protein
VVVIDLIGETMAMNVISRPIGALTKFNAIIKIRMYRRLHDENHFISMPMEAHGTPECDMDHFIKECVRLFHNRQSRDHFHFYFWIQIFRQHVNIAL